MSLVGFLMPARMEAKFVGNILQWIFVSKIFQIPTGFHMYSVPSSIY